MAHPHHRLGNQRPGAIEELRRRRPHSLAQREPQRSAQRWRWRLAQQEAQSARRERAHVRRGVAAQARCRAQRGQRVGRQQLDQVFAEQAEAGKDVLQQLRLTLGA